MDKLTPFSKALAAAISGLGASLITAAVDDGVSAAEWWVVLGSTLVAGAAVYLAPPNKPA